MSKLTIHMDEEALRRARIVAARRGMSVSRFVGAVLRNDTHKRSQIPRSPK